MPMSTSHLKLSHSAVEKLRERRDHHTHSLIPGALFAWSEIPVCLLLSAQEDGSPRRNRKWAELETMEADKHTVIRGIYVLSIKLIEPSFVTSAHLFTIIK